MWKEQFSTQSIRIFSTEKQFLRGRGNFFEGKYVENVENIPYNTNFVLYLTKSGGL